MWSLSLIHIFSYDDYAIAMVDEAEKGGHIRQRISVVAK